MRRPSRFNGRKRTCRSRLTALRPEPRRELQASAEGFTQEHIAAQFSEPWCSATFRAIPSTWERIDTAPHISLHLRAAATTYHLSISRHLTTTVSVRSAFAPHGAGVMTLTHAAAAAAGLAIWHVVRGQSERAAERPCPCCCARRRRCAPHNSSPQPRLTRWSIAPAPKCSGRFLTAPPNARLPVVVGNFGSIMPNRKIGRARYGRQRLTGAATEE